MNSGQRGSSSGAELRGRTSSWLQASVSLLVGVAAALALAPLAATSFCLLAGWDAAALAYLAWVWRVSWPRDAGETRRLAGRQDPTRATVHALIVIAAVVSLGAVGLALVNSTNEDFAIRGQTIGLGVTTVVLSWALVNTVFALRYARAYYEGEPGGFDFNQEAPPRYSDFAYVAFAVGMTFTVPDTSVQGSEIRKKVFYHTLLSYLFGTVILAVVVNLLTSLTPSP